MSGNTPVAQRLIREVSLHDGLLRTLSGDAEGLELIFRAGDQQTGYFDARLAYGRVELSSKDEEFCARSSARGTSSSSTTSSIRQQTEERWNPPPPVLGHTKRCR